MAENTQKIISIQLQATSAINGIKDLNQQIEVNKTRMAELADANQKGSAEYAKLEQHTKALSKTKQALSRETQNEIKLEYEEKGSLNALRAELSNLTKQYDKLSRAERENVNVGGKLKNQINQVTKELKAAEEGTQRYYRNVGNYQNAILGAIGVNSQFLTSMVGMENGTKGAFAAMSASAKAFGKTLMSLMSNPVFLAIAGIAGAGMAAKWFYDYNMGIEQAMRLTREFTHTSGQELSNLRAEIQATANTYGKDYKEVLDAVDTLMSHYHINGKEAIDTINDGFQAGADLNGDMLQKLQQYAPTFRDAGISADRFMAIMSQTRSGIFSEQGLDAIKQGSARIREMSNTTRTALQNIGIDVDEMQAKLRSGQMDTFDAIQQVANKLKELPNNAQEVGEVMSAVFGRQGKFASQEMIESIGSMVTEIEKLKKTTGEYGELTDELREKEVELQKAMADVFGTGNEGFEEMTLNAEIFAKDGLTGIVKGLKNVVVWIKKTWNENLILRGAVAYVAAGFRTLFFVVTRVTSLIITGIKGAIDALSVLSQSFGIIAKNISTAFAGVVDIFRGIKNMDADQVASGVKKAGGAVVQGLGNLAKGIGSAVGAGYQSIVNGVMDRVTSMFNVGSWTDNIMDFRFEMGEVNEELTQTGNILGQVKNAVKGVVSAVKDVETTTTENNGNGAGKGKGSAVKKGGATPRTTTTKTQKSPEEIALEQYNKRVAALVAKGEELHKRAVEEQAKNNIAAINELAEIERQELYKTYGDRSNYEGEALEAWDAIFMAIEQKRLDSIKKMQQANAESSRAEEKKLLETWMASTEEGTAAHYDYMLKILNMEKDAELALYENNEMMKAAIVAKYAKQEDDIRRQQAAHTIEIEEQKMTAVGSIAGALSGMMEAFGEDSKEAVALAKSLALAEMMINQAVAISGAIRKATTDPTSYTVFGMIATIAGAIAAVVGSMVQAFTSLDSAKFATGGYIQGAGTGTSDSIPVRVSNGESIMNANTTAMFSGLLSSLNQLGGGVPIQAKETASTVQGEDMLARAFARGVAMLPNPVVSVEDINRGQRQVEVMNERATL